MVVMSGADGMGTTKVVKKRISVAVPPQLEERMNRHLASTGETLAELVRRGINLALFQSSSNGG